MAETTMKLITKTDQHYADLVEAFLKDPAYAGIDSWEKKKFLQLCVVNKLNPFKKEVYPVPYWKKLQITIAYTKYLEIAEASGLLAWWTILLTKKDGKIVSGKITIHRKDWNHAFEYEADVEDFAVANNPLWKSKTEAMMRKQLIRVWFSLCFPENCKMLQAEDDPEIVIKPCEIINETPIYWPDWDRIEDEISEDMNWEQTIDNTVQAVSQDQQDMIDRLCVTLVNFQEQPKKPNNFDEAEILIRAMQFTVAKLYIKEKKLQDLTMDNINEIFVWEDLDIKKIKNAAIKYYNSIH